MEYSIAQVERYDVYVGHTSHNVSTFPTLNVLF